MRDRLGVIFLLSRITVIERPCLGKSMFGTLRGTATSLALVGDEPLPDHCGFGVGDCRSMVCWRNVGVGLLWATAGLVPVATGESSPAKCRCGPVAECCS